MDKDTNLPFDDSLRKKTLGFKRFYYINPNGISKYRNFLDLCEMLRSFWDIEVYGLGLPEVNTDPLKPAVRQRCEQSGVEFFRTALLAGSTSSLPAS